MPKCVVCEKEIAFPDFKGRCVVCAGNIEVQPTPINNDNNENDEFQKPGEQLENWNSQNDPRTYNAGQRTDSSPYYRHIEAAVAREGFLSNKNIPLFLLICCILLLFITIGMIVSLTRSKVDCWVYKTEIVEGLALGDTNSRVFNMENDTIKSLGYSGWELCSVVPVTETLFPNFGSEEYHVGIKTNTRTQSLILLFKRKQ